MLFFFPFKWWSCIMYLILQFAEHLFELEQLLNGIAMMKELTPRTRDYLVSFGECMSTRIFSAYLNKIGVKSCQVCFFFVHYLKFSPCNKFYKNHVNPCFRSNKLAILFLSISRPWGLCLPHIFKMRSIATLAII